MGNPNDNPFEAELDKWDQELRKQKREKIAAEQADLRSKMKDVFGLEDDLLAGKVLNAEEAISSSKQDQFVKKQAMLRVNYPNNPTCNCGCVMMERTNKKTGDKFWGCSNYPTCTGTKQMGKVKVQIVKRNPFNTP